jgi:hypothetical protein
MFNYEKEVILKVKNVFGFLVLILLMLFVITACSAAPATPGSANFPDLVTELMSLAGVGAFIAVVINILKATGVVNDGTAPTWAAGLNVLGLVILFILHVFVPSTDISNLNTVAGQVAQIAALVVGLVIQLLSSKAAHFALKGVPLVGYSYSLRLNKPMPSLQPK